MVIYQLEISDLEEGHLVSYHPSKRGAIKAASERRKLEPGTFECYRFFRWDIRPTKAGVISFLNHATPSHDNG